MNNLYDVLEICLQELENGADMESVLARYPDLSSELRPVLNASIKARMRSVAVPAPSPEIIRRGRAKLLQHASEMREAKIAPRRRMIPLFQRLAISFLLAALFLASGTGLVGASSSALPGENLYPVKLTWENLRLFLTFDDDSRELLEHTFENERLDEINELLTEGRHETIQFTGVFMEVNGQTYVSGIRIMILDTTVLPADKLLNGTAVIVTGRTNAEGFVNVESIELLPAGTIVPTGEPPEIETEHSQNGNGNGNENVNINDNDDFNDNADDNGYDSVNDNSNDNVNDNADENGDDNNNANSNDNINDNANENVNENADDNGNDNVNENVGDNSNDDVNENVGDNGNDNGDENANDNSNDNGGEDSGGGGED